MCSAIYTTVGCVRVNEAHEAATAHKQSDREDNDNGQNWKGIWFDAEYKKHSSQPNWMLSAIRWCGCRRHRRRRCHGTAMGFAVNSWVDCMINGRRWWHWLVVELGYIEGGPLSLLPAIRQMWFVCMRGKCFWYFGCCYNDNLPFKLNLRPGCLCVCACRYVSGV